MLRYVNLQLSSNKRKLSLFVQDFHGDMSCANEQCTETPGAAASRDCQRFQQSRAVLWRKSKKHRHATIFQYIRQVHPQVWGKPSYSSVPKIYKPARNLYEAVYLAGTGSWTRTTETGYLGSIPGRVILKTSKMVIVTICYGKRNCWRWKPCVYSLFSVKHLMFNNRFCSTIEVPRVFVAPISACLRWS